MSLRSDLTRGGQFSLLQLASGLRSTAYRPVVAVPSEGELADSVRSLGIPVFVLGEWPHFAKTYLWTTFASISRLRGVIDEIGASIVHADAPRLAHLAALAKPSVKRVMHLRVSTHDGVSDTLLASHSDALIAISRGVADRFLRFPLAVQRKIHVVYNGIDTERFIPLSGSRRKEVRKAFGLPVQTPLVTMLAAFVPFKRHKFVVDFWKEVHEQTGAVLVLAGGGDEGLREEIRREILNRDLNKAIRLLPPTPHPEDLLGCADLNLLASIEDEGLGRVIPEAASCGVPSVAADAPGVRETILPGLTGILLPIKSKPEQWSNEVTGLLKDPERLAMLGANAEQFARERFGALKYVQGVCKVYDSLLRAEIS